VRRVMEMEETKSGKKNMDKEKSKNYKTFVVTTIVKVSENCKGYKADKEMVKRLMQENEEIGFVEKNCFRKKVVLEIKEVKSEVIEV